MGWRIHPTLPLGPCGLTTNNKKSAAKNTTPSPAPWLSNGSAFPSNRDWQQRVPYDEATYMHALQTRNPELYQFAGPQTGSMRGVAGLSQGWPSGGE